MVKSKILVIDDDLKILRLIKNILEKNSYVVETRNSVEDINLCDFIGFDLILLDIKLPQESGYSICSQIRGFSNVPIIFVTSCNTDMDELNSILLGGDAFVTKPYNTAILLAKISSLLKRAYPAEQGERLVWQGAVLHLESSTIEYDGRQAELTKNELKIIYYLFKHAGKICPRNDIVDYLWDNQLYVDDNALSVNIARIREKLSAIGLTGFIKTKHRQGYTL